MQQLSTRANDDLAALDYLYHEMFKHSLIKQIVASVAGVLGIGFYFAMTWYWRDAKIDWVFPIVIGVISFAGWIFLWSMKSRMNRGVYGDNSQEITDIARFIIQRNQRR